MCYMTVQPEYRPELEPDLADRMRKSLRVSDVPVQAIAGYLDVDRNTVGRWINGRSKPSTAVLRVWALRTGVPYEWLRNGWAPRGSNPEPTVLGVAQVVNLFRRRHATMHHDTTEPGGYVSSQVAALRSAV